MSDNTLDRVQTSTLLAKIHAQIGVGNIDAAKTYARMLVKALRDADLIGKPILSIGGGQ